MADIELIIKMPEEVYESIQDNDYCGISNSDMYNAIVNGTPLPKGHGRLIDADALDRDLENAKVNLGDALSEAFDDGLTWASEVTSKLLTIIEADKESEDKE